MQYRDSISKESAKQMVGKGWSSLLDEVYASLRKETKVLQVKEKFGGLRVYVGSATPEEYRVIGDCEKRSYKVCEICGKDAKTRVIQGWDVTLCDNCYRKERSGNADTKPE